MKMTDYYYFLYITLEIMNKMCTCFARPYVLYCRKLAKSYCNLCRKQSECHYDIRLTSLEHSEHLLKKKKIKSDCDHSSLLTSGETICTLIMTDLKYELFSGSGKSSIGKLPRVVQKVLSLIGLLSFIPGIF